MTKRNFLSAIFVGLLTIILILPNVSQAADGTAELIIFHTNDMHCRIVNTDDDGKSIGLAEMAAAVKAAKKKISTRSGLMRAILFTECRE